ncbi:MAG: relaxase/mobilization nuclease domain-containing protein [Desulfovibrionaceae bacterium]|nr:relaxase/mobilization nuclease domain-containing protein [Desulfovibrionaceae bacterium]
MIVKKFKAKQAKSRAQHVHDIMDYTTGQKELDDKVLHTEFVNFQSAEYEDIKSEMIVLAEKAPSNSKNPVMHMMISLRSGETPSNEEARKAVKTMLTELGYQDCQHAFSVHQNTDNYHLHIAVNRVDPVIHKVHWHFRDTDLMHKALARIEKEQGWSREKNALYVEIDNEVIPTRNVEELSNVKIPPEARAMEHRTGEQSAARIAAEEALPILLTRESWGDVHRDLAAIGYEYKLKGGGAVLVAHIDGQEIGVKPSDLHKKAALKGMTDRLGPYEALAVEVVDRRPEPLPDMPREVFDRFQAEKSATVEKSTDIHAQHEHMKMELQKERKEILKALQDPSTDWTGKGVLLAAMQKVTSEYHKDQIGSLTERYKEKIQSNRQIMDKVSDLETWVSLNCPQYSEQVKSAVDRASTQVELKIDQPLTGELAEKYTAFVEYHKSVGAERYRITSKGEKDGKPIAYVFGRDPETKIAEGFTADEVHKHIGHMLRFAKKGEHLYFTPLSETTHHILVDDLNRERLDKMRADGYNPSVVIESSPGNFQAIVNVPKLGEDKERDKLIGNKISEGLNRVYGDVNLSGAIHPHRVPEFPNAKIKYMAEDGSFPLAKVTHKDGGTCNKLTAFSLYMNEHFDYIMFKNKVKKNPQEDQEKEAELKRQKEAQEQTKQTQEHEQKRQDLVSLYRAHKKAALRHANLKEEEANASRVDAMIAVRLRGTGHNKTQVEAILRAGAPEGRGDAHKWAEYSQKTAEHAFSEENTRKLRTQFSRFVKQWREIERKALEKDVPVAVKDEARQKQITQQQQQQQQKKSQEKKHGLERKPAIKPKQQVDRGPGSQGFGPR